MTVSAMTPSVATPGLVPTAATAAQAQPIGGLGAAGATAGIGSAVVGAQQAQPGIGSRLVLAMKAAISELRGKGATDAQINQQLLAMQAQSQATPAAAATAMPAGVAKAKAKAKPKAAAKPKTAAQKQAAAAKAKQAAAAKAALPVAGAAAAGAAVGAVAGSAAGQLPANATQLPNGTVYSYADANNAGLAGLQGLSPQQQLQLGIMPTGMGSTLGALGQRAEGGVPQANVTNQSSTGATGVLGTLGVGIAPTIGAPILGNTNLSAPAAGTTPPAAPVTGQPPMANTTGGNQNVVNRNRSDSGAFNQGTDYGMGWGGVGGYPYTGGIATPYSPYGASMTGASMVNGQLPQQSSGGILGWFGRLFS